MSNLSLNPIEQCYRTCVANGRAPLKLFLANPNDEGIVFPGEILSDSYARYFQRQEYRPDPKGLRVAREAISQYYAGRGAAIDPEYIVLTAGTSESFFYLFSLLAEPGDNILTPTPSYPLFDEIARLAHVTLRPYRLDESWAWAIDCDSVREAIDARTRAIVIVSPHNPTGMVVDAATLRILADVASAAGIPLICDEVFSEFIADAPDSVRCSTGAHPMVPGTIGCSIDGHQNGSAPFSRAMQVATLGLCFTLNGISKMLALPAMKCSWIAVTGDPIRVAAAVDRLEHMTDTFLSCHYPIQQALPELLQRGQTFLAAYRAEVAQRRALALSILQQSPHLRCHPPQGGFYLMVEVLDDRWSNEDDCVCDLMQNHGIFPHPGYFYDHERGIHLVLSTLLTPERLRDGCVKLNNAVVRR